MDSDSEGCGICGSALTIPNTSDDEGEGPAEYPDDVELRCGCHYHWQCLVDRALQLRKNECPVCGPDSLELEAGGGGRFLAVVRNEGGVTDDFDMGAELDEQRFLAAHPDVERAETFIGLVDQGDLDAAEEMLRVDGPKAVDVNCTARDGRQTALHLAAYNNDVDAIGMLLRHGADRNARDELGMTPLDCAREVKAEAAVALLSS